MTKADSRAARRWTLVATILASSLTFIDGTVVNVALPALQADMRATITDVQWVIEAYALFLGGLILVGGSLGDQFGRKRTFLAGVVVFTGASIACGFAESTRWLIAWRAVQGIGAAFLVPGSLAIISATFDDAERGRAIGTWSGFSAITSAIGPVIGGWLIEHVSWRAVFFLNVPMAAIVILLSQRFVAESHDASRSRGIDWRGAALAVAGLSAAVYALLEWPNQNASRVLVLSMLAFGVAALALLVVVERRVHDPMLPLALFRSRPFTLTNLLTLLIYSALAVVFLLLPLNLIQVQHYSATAASAALLPFPLLMFVLSRWSGGLTARVGSRLPLTVGPVVAAAGLALMARAGFSQSYWSSFFPAVTVLGLGMAIIVAPLTTTAMAAVDSQHAGVASGVNNAVARVAALLGVAVAGILLVQSFNAIARRSLDQLNLSDEVRASVERELPKLAAANVAEPAAREVIDAAFVAAFRAVMNFSALVVLAAAAVGAFIRCGRPSTPAVRDMAWAHCYEHAK